MGRNPLSGGEASSHVMALQNALLLMAAVAAAALIAGCAEPAPEESAAPQDAGGDMTTPRETDVPGSQAAVCPNETTAPGGYGTTGATRPGEVGTGTGDIGSDVACPAAPGAE
jgi:hypothetical protein